MRDTEKAAETQAEGEVGSDVGLDPGTPASCPGPKAGAKRLSHPRIPLAWVSMREAQLNMYLLIVVYF